MLGPISSAHFRGKRCFVTGATGLLGGQLISQLLAQGAEIFALVRDWRPTSFLLSEGPPKGVTLIRGELADRDLLERCLFDYEITHVFHLGAQTRVPIARVHPLDTFEANVRGTWVLMEALRRYGRVELCLLASSDKIYGPLRDLPYTESTRPDPIAPYDTSKLCSELVACSYARSFGVPLLRTRCGNLYGPGDLNWDRLIPGTIRSLIKDEAPIIRSDGSPRRDFVYVGDGARIILRLMEGGAARSGEVYNIGTGQPNSVLEVVDAIAKALGGDAPAPKILGEAPGEIQDQWLDASRLEEALGTVSYLSLKEGLALTLPWYQALLA